MMRHFRVSPVTQPHIAVRTKMTGFNLFTKHVQEERKVLKARSFEKGRANMRIMARLWRKLPVCRRAMYNEWALQRDTFVSSDPEKKNNTFNLLMRLFSSDKVLLKAGDESFTALMAKSTMHAMRKQDIRRLQAKLKIKAFCTSKDRPYVSVTASYKRFVSPDMLLFNSFTEMQRSVAPTRRSAFAAITKALSVSNITVSGEEYVMKRYKTLSPEQRNWFAPISDSEAPFFEMFCASRCAGFNRRRFEIIRLFASFRGVEIDLGSNAIQDELYRSFINTDRSRDGIYFRARRSLERLEALRSSDCGSFIAKRLPESRKVDPAAYGIDTCLDDVGVATVLAETRVGRSVYDDVITRASILRAKDKNKQLSIYNVAQMMPREASSHSQFPTERLKNIKFSSGLSVARSVRDLKTAVKQTHKKNPSQARVLSTKRLVVKKKSKLAHTMFIASKAAVAKVTPAASSEKKAPSALKRQLTKRRAIKIFSTKAKSVNASSRSRVGVDAAVNDVAAASKRVLSKDTVVFQAAAATEKHEDSLFAEEEDDDRAGPDFVNNVSSHKVTPTTAPKAPSQVCTPARNRAARSHLLTPESMLPATARAQKVIAAHASTYRKAQRPVSTAESLPFTPARRKMSFADNIRAQLASSL
ncbi:hypothetical protein JKF63_06183 [Porcisia hertigi]|uniref:Uncharacterized protein n=1 Tax=Porcisia hertigi TaxID=2761500 RepID=A0A836IBT6_9TRYP|nr:hypothetical protein JKF63_06183 [Porcisia hertigi]